MAVMSCVGGQRFSTRSSANGGFVCAMHADRQTIKLFARPWLDPLDGGVKPHIACCQYRSCERTLLEGSKGISIYTIFATI
jgi:hypothetical protein